MEIKRVLDLDPFSLMDTRVTHTLLPTEWLCRYLIPSPCRWCGLDVHVQKECFLTQKDRPSWNGSFSLILSSSWLWGFDQKQPSLAPTQAGTWGSTLEPLCSWRVLKTLIPGDEAFHEHGGLTTEQSIHIGLLILKKPGTRQSRSIIFFFWDKISPWTWSLSVQQY